MQIPIPYAKRMCHVRDPYVLRAFNQRPPKTMEQSSKTPSSLWISSLILWFSFLNNLISPESPGDDDRRCQSPAMLPRFIEGDLATAVVSSSSTPIPESLHHPESSSPSDIGDM